MLLHCKTAFAFQASSESCLQPMSSVMDCDEPHLEPSSDLTTSLEIALGKKNHCLAQGCVPSPNVWSMWKCKGPAHPLNDGRQLQRSLEATVRSAEAFPEMASWPNCSHTSPFPPHTGVILQTCPETLLYDHFYQSLQSPFSDKKISHFVLLDLSGFWR
jgi:hypothetical protein